MAANTPTGAATGSWSLISGFGVIANPTLETTPIFGLALGTNVFRWTIVDFPGPIITTSDMTITIEDAPTISLAGPNQTLCSTIPSATMAANTPIVGNGFWTISFGGGTITNSLSPNTTITGIPVGMNIYAWTIQNPPCLPNSVSEVTVFVSNPPSISVAGPNQTICSVPGIVAMNANVPGVGTGVWSIVSGGGTIVSPTQNNTSINAVPIGTNVFAWTISNPPCPPSVSQVTVIVREKPNADAGLNQTLCITGNSAVMAANQPTAPMTGLWSLVAGGGVIVTPSSYSTTINALPSGTNIFQWTMINPPCGAGTSTVAIIVNLLPTVANAGVNKTVCTVPGTTVMTGNNPAVGSGSWTLISGGGNITTPTSFISGITAIPTGSNVFMWTISNAPCPASTSNMTIIARQQPTSVAGPNQTLCVTSNTAIMAGNLPSPAPMTGNWTRISGPAPLATIVAPTLYTTAINTFTVGTHVYRWTLSNAPCPASASDMTVVITATPTTANAGANQTICSNPGTAVLAGNAPVVGTGTWSVFSGTATITNTLLFNSGVTAAAVGTNVLRWTIANGTACPVSFANMTLTVRAQPTAVAGPNQTLCISNNTVIMAGNQPTPAPMTGNWTRISGPAPLATIVAPTIYSTAVNTFTTGVHVYRWTLSNTPACPATSAADMTVNIIPLPTIANAGSNSVICSSPGSVTLGGNAPGAAPNTGSWTVISGTATIANSTLNTSSVTAIAVGTNVLRWTISTGTACASSVSDVTITVRALPTSVAGTNQTLCINSNTAVMAANIPTPTPMSGLWTIISGGGAIVANTNYSTAINTIPTGTNVYLWTMSNAPCPNATSNITVFVSGLPSPVNAGSNQTLCATTSSAVMAATTVTSGIGTWSLISGSGTISNSLSPTATITALASGTNIFQWTVSSPPCTASITTVAIYVNNPPNVAAAGPNQTLCITSANALMAANAATAGVGTWSLISGSGVITNSLLPNTTITGIGLGVNVFQWRITNSPCPQSTSNVTITVNQVPTVANAGSNQTVCITNPTVNISGNFPLNGTGTWSLISGSGVITNSLLQNTSITGMGLGNNVFAWIISNAPCLASSSNITITVNNIPTVANAGSNQTLCISSPNAVMAANAATVGVGTWSVISGSGTITNSLSPTTAITGIGLGVNVFAWTISNPPCLASTSNVTVIVNQVPSVSNAGPNQTLCITSPNATMAANFPGVGAGTWSLISGSGVITNSLLPNTTITGLGAGINVFAWIISNNPCAPSSSNVTLTVNNLATVANAGPSQTLCLDSPNALMAANTATNGIGTWSLVSGSGVITNSLLPNTSITGIGLGINVFAWTISNPPCLPSTSNVTVIVNQVPTIASAGSNQTLCISNPSTTVTGNFPIVGTGTWSLISGSGVITNSLLVSTTITGLGLGNNVFAWTISNSPCAPSTSNLTITVNNIPSIASAGPNQTLCITSPNALMAANTATVGVGTWSLVSGSGVITNSLLPNTTITGIGLGVNVFAWTISNNPCSPSTSNVTITVNDVPTIANAGSNQTLCTGSTATMSANTATVGVGTWSLISGTGVITNSLLPNTTITGLGVGPNVFAWTITNAPCIASSSNVTITINQNPSIASAGPNQTLCITSPNAIMAANNATIGVGTWSLVLGSGVITNSLLPNTSITGLGLGVNVFAWTISNNPCSPSTSNVTLTVNDVPTVANAGSNQTLCTGSTATMSANTATVGVGTWSLISGTGVITNSLLPNTTITGLGVGPNVFAWTITNAPCIASSSNVTITINQNPSIAAAGPNQTLCITSANALMAANTATVGVGTWSLVSGSGVITNSLLPNTTITGIGLGVNVFAWTISNNPCAPSTSNVTLTVNDVPTIANAGSNQTLCTGSTATMSANTATVGVGTWSLISGTGVITNSLLPNTTITGLGVGPNVFAWTITNAPCVASSSNVTITINQNPSIASAGPNQTLCITSPNAFMAANTATVGVGSWSVVLGSGTISNSLAPNTSITGIGLGVNVFAWTISNNPCSPSTSNVTITVNDVPTIANAGSNQTLCTGSTATMSANTATVGVGTWSLISGTGVITNSLLPNTTITGLGVGPNVFAWTITNAPCIASSSNVTITINQNPSIASAGPNQTLCITSPNAIMAANNATIGVGTWSLVLGSGVITNSLLPNTSITGLGLGVNVFAWTISNNPCSPSTSNVTLTVNDVPTVANAGSNQTLCTGSTATMSANTATVGVGTWSLISGTGVITNSLLPNTTITGLGVGPNVFAWTITNAPCIASSSNVTITINQNPSIAAAGPNQTLCITSANALMAANTATVGVGTWSLVSGSGVITNSLLPNTTITGIGLGVNVFAWTISNNPCAPSTSNVTLTVNDVPTIANAGSNQTLCTGSTATMSANTATVGVGTWSLISGSGIITSSLLPNTTITGLGLGPNVFAWTITNAPCVASSSNVTITINQNPSIASAGPNQTLCITSPNAFMAANTATVGVGSWSVVLGSGTISNSLAPNTSITGIGLGVNVFAWTISNNPCSPSTSNVTITVNDLPTIASAGSNQTLCTGSSATMAANNPIIGVGTWSLISGSGVITNSLLANTTITGLGLGVNVFAWTILNSPCVPSVSNVTITTNQVPSIAVAGVNQTLCITSPNTIMGANSPTSGTGAWTLVSGSGVITNSLSPNTSVTGIGLGINVFAWTISNNPCSPSTSNVTITVNQVPTTANAGSNQTLCISSPTAFMAANFPGIGSGAWTLVSGSGVITNSLLPNTTITGLGLGTNVFAWTISNNPCAPSVSNVTIFINQVPSISSAGPSQTLCITAPNAFMAANTPTVGSGAWTIVSGSGVITNSLLPNTSITGIGLGVNVFAWTISNAPCLASSSNVTVIVNQNPSPAIAGPNQTLCITNPNTVMAANFPGIGAGAWTLISGSGTISNSLSPTSNIIALGLGANVFAWTVSNAPCLPTVSNVTIFVNPAPSISTAGPNQTLCITSPNAFMAANVPVVGTGAWTLISGSGTISNSLSPVTSITGIGLGVNVFAWTISNAPCLASTSNVTIIVNPDPSPAVAGPNQTLCITSPNTVMAANFPGVGNGAWTLVSGSGVITNSLSPSTAVTGLGLGTNVFAWTVSNAPCLPSVSNVTIFVNQIPSVSSAGPSQTICISSPNALMAANVPINGTGTWSIVSGSGVITNSLLANTTITGLGLGINVFAWTISNLPCVSSVSNVTIIVNQVPTLSNAGPNQTICIGTPTTVMAANFPGVGAGTWSLISGTGVITNSLSPNTSVTGLGLGTNVFAWTIANAPCAPSSSNMTITVNQVPTIANAGGNQTLCITSPTTILNANTATVGVGSWSLILGSGVISNSLLPITSVSGLGLGVNVFAWTISNLPCSPSTSNVTITVNDFPTVANAGPNQTLCISSPTAVMAANIPTVGAGTWSLISGSGIITNSAVPNTTITGLGLGVNVFAWTISNNPCAPSVSNVTINVNQVPTIANAGGNQTLCISSPTTVMSANAATVGVGSWSLIVGSGIISNSLSPLTPITGLGLGVNVFAWTISNLPCSPSTSNVTITVNDLPTVSNAGPTQTLCVNVPNATLAANAATVGTGVWTFVSGSGVITNSLLPNSTITGLGLGVNVLAWTISNPPCAASSSTMAIIVNPGPTISNAGPNQLLCITSPTALMAANTATQGIGTWSLIAGSGVITNSLLPNTTVTGLGVGVNVFSWIINDLPCIPSASNVTITVSDVPTISNAGPNQTLCVSSPTTIMAANAATVGVGTWSLISGSGVITNSLSPITSITGLGVGVNVFAWTIVNSPCNLSTSNVTIFVNQIPTVSNAGPNQALCFNVPNTIMAANTATFGVGTWSLIAGSGVITNSLSPVTSITGLGMGVNVFAWIISNAPCPASVSNMTIQVNPGPTIADAGPSQTLCAGTTATMAANIATLGTGSWSLIAGSGVITNSLLPNTTITGLGLGNNVFRWTISSNPCIPTTADVTITINQVPTIASAGANQTLCITSPNAIMAANTATVGVGSWSLILGSGTISNSLSPITSITGIGLGVNVFAWTISNNPCPPSTSNITITVNDNPSIANAGPSQTICVSTPTALMAANAATVGIGTWSLISGSGVITNSLLANTSITGLGLGVNVFAWTISNNPCVASISNVSITVNQIPSIASAGPNQTLCILNPNALMAANSATVGIGTWSLIAGSGVITNSLLPNTTITGLGLGINVFAWIISNSPCAATSSTITLLVNDDPTIANAGANQTLCISNPTTMMAANFATVGIGTWSLISGSGTITNSLSPNTTITGLGLGNNVFAWTIANSPCAPTISNVTITVNDVPTISSAGPNQTLCITSPNTLMAANTATVGIGTWSLIAGSGVITNSLSPITSITGLGLGANVFAWTISNAPCLASTSNVTITLNNVPTIANAGVSQTLCITSPTTLVSANTATVGVGTWSLISGSGVISNSLLPITTITGLGLGTNVFAWTITNPPCLASISNLSITVNDIPTVASAGPNQTVCLSNPIALMAANTPTAGVGTWSLISGSGIITNSLLPNTTITNLGLGINIFAWTISNNPCIASTSNITITVNQDPSVANAGTNQTLCISTPTTIMTANTPTVGVGTWSLISGSGVIANSTLATTGVTGLGLGVNVFGWTISNAPCLPTTSNVTITVNQAPTIASAGINQTLCITSPTAVMAANSATVGVGTWSLILGSGTISNSLSPVTSITGLGIGANVFAWTIANAPCLASVSNVTIFVNDIPTTANAGANQTLCIATPTTVMSANTATIGVGTWSLIAGTGVITNSLSPTTAITGLAVGVNVFAWTITNAPCLASVSNVTITVNDVPTIANAGINQTLCISSPIANMAANNATVGVGTWSLVSGSGIITNSLLPNTTITGLGLGVNVFAWTITNNPCIATTSNVTLTVNDIPSIANAGINQTLCISSPTTIMTANTPTVGVGTWSLISGSGVITNSTLPNTGITGLGLGINVFAWTISNAPCLPTTSNITITVNDVPTVSNAGPNQTLCITSPTAVMAANNATVGVGTWSLILGSGTISNSLSPVTSITGLGLGANVFAWTITNAPCLASTSNVTINVNDIPTVANAGINQILCISSPTTVMTANTATIGVGTWSLISGSGVITNSLSPTTSITGLGLGVNVFAWTISNAPCLASISNVTITVNDVPTIATAGPNQTVCISSPNAVMAANNATVGTGTWSLVSGSGIITNSLLPNTSITGLGLGVNVFAWTITNNPCIATTSNVTLTVNDVPTIANAGPNQTVCISTPVALMAANFPTVGVGTWSLISGSGTITNSLSPTTNITGLGLGANVFAWTISNTPCLPTTSNVTITVNDVPTIASAGPNQTVCISSPNAIMAANTATVGVGSWSLILGSGTISNSLAPNTFITNLGLGVNVFAWTISNTPCLASVSNVTIIVNDLPTVSNAGPNQTVCISSPNAVMAANFPGIGNGAWTLVAGSGVITNSLLPTTSITGLGLGNNVFAWTISNNPCTPSSSNVTITVNDNPSIATAGPNQTVCISSPNTLMAANTATIGIGTWSLISGSGTITNSLSPITSITGMGLGVNVFAWTISNNPCISSSSNVSITVNDVPTISNAGVNQTLCISNPTTAMTANFPGVGTGAWTLVSGSGVITNSISPVTGITGLGLGNNVFAWTISNLPCAPSVSNVTLTVNQVPSIASAGANSVVCINNPTVTMAGNVPGVGIGAWSLVSGAGTITNPLQVNTTITGLGLGTNVFAWTISNPPCAASISNVTITVDDMPTPASAGPNQTICTTSSTLNATVPVVGNSVWSVLVGGSTIVSPLSPLSLVNTLLVGTNVLAWTTTNGVCPATVSNVTIIVNPFPTPANAGPDFTVCSTTATLNGNVPFVGNGVWTVTFGGATVTNSLVNNSGVTGLTLGNNTFVWTTGFGSCPNSFDAVNIFVDTPPSASSAGPNQNICINNGTLNATVPVVGTGLWTMIVGGSTVTTPTLNNSTVTGLITGTNTFIWSVSNGVCPTSTSAVNIVVDQFPSVSVAGTDFTICSSTTTMNANAPLIGVGNWSVLAGGSSVTTPTLSTSGVTSLSTGINNLAWTISNGSCPPSTSTVSVFVDAFPSVANAGPNQAFCLTTTTANLSAILPSIGTGTWSVISGGGAVSSPTLNSSNVSGLTAGTNSLVWTTSNRTCPVTRDTMNIVLELVPTVSNAGPDQSICPLSTTLAANTPTIGNGVWSVISGSSTVTNSLVNNSTVYGLSTPTNALVWTITNGSCPPSRDTVFITILPPTPQAYTTNDTIIYTTSVSITGNTPPGIGSWQYVSGSYNITNASIATTTLTGLRPGLNTVKWTITDVCGTTEDELNITLLEVDIPNAVSPNGDGKNDYFEIPISDAYTSVELKILNRWGSVVYEDRNYKNDWNGVNQGGQPLSEDTYFYVISLDGKLKTGYIILKR